MSTTTLRQLDLATPRLRLRRLRQADAGLIALYSSDVRIARMTSRIPHPYPPGAAEAYVSRILATDNNELVWAMDAGNEGENGLVGLISLRAKGGEGLIGFWVAPAFWGTGYATEAVEAVTRFAGEAGLTGVVAHAFRDNAASSKVLTRAGFRVVGSGEEHSVARGRMVPIDIFRHAPADG